MFELLELRLDLHFSHAGDNGGLHHLCPDGHPFAQSLLERNRLPGDSADLRIAIAVNLNNCLIEYCYGPLPIQNRLGGYLHYFIYASALKENFHKFVKD